MRSGFSAFDMGKIRSFIAIELPEEVKAGLSSAVDSLRPARHPYVKWVQVDGIHLTLVFLGNIDREQVSPITDAMAVAAKGLTPFRLELGGLGAFPNLRRPQVIWVAVGGEVEKVASLKRGIDSALLPLGFTPESRSFKPHLTVGRLRERASAEERRHLGELVMGTGFQGGFPFEVGEVSLMRSRLTPSGAIYSRISSIALKGGLSTSNF
jgi:2'-5' RNA ligase